MDKHEVCGKEYDVTGIVYIEGLDELLPLVDIPMMSDEKWIALSKAQKEEKKHD